MGRYNHMAKLTDKQKLELRTAWGDWEMYHSVYDDLVWKRLAKLDPQYCKELLKETKGATFWYA